MSEEREEHLRQNFLSVDKKVAMDSYGTYFKVGDVVGHEGAPEEERATISKFEIDEESAEVLVHTNMGTCHLDFIYIPE